MARGDARIALSLRDEVQEYQRMQVVEARAAALQADIELELALCGGDPALQRRQLAEMAARPEGARPYAIIVQPQATTGLDSVARDAIAAGIGWVALGPVMSIDTLRREFPGKLVAQVSTAHREIGVLQARICLQLLPRGGNVLCIEGPSVSPVVMLRREGIRAGLLGTNVEIVKTLTGDWSEVSAEKAVTFWIRLGSGAVRPDLVVCQNDSMAVGARRAFQALKPDWLRVPFVGCDGLPDGGVKLVEEKVLAATIVQPSITRAAVELVAAAARGGTWSPVTLLSPRPHPDRPVVGRG